MTATSNEEHPLHHNVVHVGRRIGVCIVLLALLLANLAVLRDSGNPAHALGLLLPAIILAASWPTIWRSRRVYASDRGLRIEHGGESRLVPWRLVSGVSQPFWVINPLSWFESRTLELSDGSRVLFFPSPGAVAEVKARLKAEQARPNSAGS